MAEIYEIICPQCSKPHVLSEQEVEIHGRVFVEVRPAWCDECGLVWDSVPMSVWERLREEWKGDLD